MRNKLISTRNEPNDETLIVEIDEFQNPDTSDSTEVSYSCDFGSISVHLPENWSYTIQKYDKTSIESCSTKFGISFYPNAFQHNNAMETSINLSVNSVSICYWPDFAVCGTGLKEIETAINGMPARMGIYDEQSHWDFIILTGEYDGYVLLNKPESSDWWNTYKGQIEQILQTLIIKTSHSNIENLTDTKNI